MPLKNSKNRKIKHYKLKLNGLERFLLRKSGIFSHFLQLYISSFIPWRFWTHIFHGIVLFSGRKPCYNSFLRKFRFRDSINIIVKSCVRYCSLLDTIQHVDMFGFNLRILPFVKDNISNVPLSKYSISSCWKLVYRGVWLNHGTPVSGLNDWVLIFSLFPGRKRFDFTASSNYATSMPNNDR